jgi:hypothetical protein
VTASKAGPAGALRAGRRRRMMTLTRPGNTIAGIDTDYGDEPRPT